MYVCMHVCMCTCIHIHIYIYIYLLITKDARRKLHIRPSARTIRSGSKADACAAAEQTRHIIRLTITIRVMISLLIYLVLLLLLTKRV